MKEKGKIVFINAASIMSIAMVAAVISQVPFLKGTELMLGVVLTAFGFEKVKSLVSKLPGLK